MPPEWLAPETLDEALELKAERGGEATVVAGGTFVGILVNQRLLAPAAFLSLRGVPGLDYVEANGELRLGAMTTHRSVELSPAVRAGWPALARAFGLGEQVVSGHATPDHYVLDRTGTTKREHLVNGGVLEPEELRALADLGRALEAHFGGPQDVEWAIRGGELYLLQSRPVTSL